MYRKFFLLTLLAHLLSACASIAEEKVVMVDVSSDGFANALNKLHSPGFYALEAKKVCIDGDCYYLVFESIGSGVVFTRVTLFAAGREALFDDLKWRRVIRFGGEVSCCSGTFFPVLGEDSAVTVDGVSLRRVYQSNSTQRKITVTLSKGAIEVGTDL